MSLSNLGDNFSLLCIYSLIVGIVWFLLTCTNASWKGERPSIIRVPDRTWYIRQTIENITFVAGKFLVNPSVYKVHKRLNFSIFCAIMQKTLTKSGCKNSEENWLHQRATAVSIPSTSRDPANATATEREINSLKSCKLFKKSVSATGISVTKKWIMGLILKLSSTFSWKLCFDAFACRLRGFSREFFAPLCNHSFLFIRANTKMEHRTLAWVLVITPS